MATRYQFVDDSGETRLAGFLQPEPGGSSSLRVVGPYTVTAADNDPMTGAAPVTTLAQGDMLLRGILVVTQDFDNGVAGINLAVGDPSGSVVYVGGSDVPLSELAANYPAHGAAHQGLGFPQSDTGAQLDPVAFAVAGSAQVSLFFGGSGDPNNGSAQVWLQIATPVAPA